MKQNEVEAAVVEAVARILNRDSVDPAANFFAQGGDSLAALVLVAELEETFEIELPVESVFDAEDLVDIAEQVRSTVLAARAPA
jgi:acyl carrier protein